MIRWRCLGGSFSDDAEYHEDPFGRPLVGSPPGTPPLPGERPATSFDWLGS